MSDHKNSTEKDLWRDTPVRLIAYANEIGESFRYIFPRMYKPSYAIAFAYCCGDVQDKAYKTYKSNNYKYTNSIAINSFDAMLW